MTHAGSVGQTIGAKRAEFGRPYSGEEILSDEVLATRIRERAATTVVDAEELTRRGVPLSPFLEIGAGSVQRSIALANHQRADGVATDISQNALRDAPYVLSLLRQGRAPMRICCDAHHLPFLDDTFRYVFAYQTLHHFENPVPVVAECYRVLGRGGYFFFDEEPLDTRLRRLARGRRMLSHPPTRAQRIAARLGVEKVFWDDGAHERSLGIVEGRPDIATWREALACFGSVEAVVNRRLRFGSNLRTPMLSALLSGLVGGNIRGLCLKLDGMVAASDFRERLMCPDCLSANLAVVEREPILCRNCGRTYPVVEGVYRMLPAELEAQLCLDAAEPPAAPPYAEAPAAEDVLGLDASLES